MIDLGLIKACPTHEEISGAGKEAGKLSPDHMTAPSSPVQPGNRIRFRTFLGWNRTSSNREEKKGYSLSQWACGECSRMKMGKLEKRHMRSEGHIRKNIALIERLMSKIDLSGTRAVLEVGCGVGGASSHLATEYGMDITGIDVDEEQIEMAKKLSGENVRFAEADATNLPFENDRFDMVLSFGVMHHIGNWERALQEICRVLRPNGYLVYGDLAYSRFTVRLLRRIVKKYGIYTIDDIIQFLEGNDLKLAHREEPDGRVMKFHTMVFRKGGS